MSVDLQVIRAAEFVCFDPDEHLDLDASKQAVRSLALACRKRGLARALVDLRKLPILAKPHFTKSELAALVEALLVAGFSQAHRLAVVYRADVFGGIRDFAFIGRMRGLRVQAFTDFEAAMQWLWEGEETLPECRQKPDTVFIRKRKNAMKSPPLGMADAPAVLCAARHIRVRPTARS